MNNEPLSFFYYRDMTPASTYLERNPLGTGTTTVHVITTLEAHPR